MQKHFPVGATQAKVLKALGLTAENFDHANAIFDHIGIEVSSKRQGRETVPVIRLRETSGGAFNAYGEGESWDLPAEYVDLTPVLPWIVDADRAAAENIIARVKQQQQQQPSPAATDASDEDEDERAAVDAVTTLLSESTPHGNTSAQLSWSGYTSGTELVTFRRGDRWYAVLQGISSDGNAFESEDIGPFDTRAEAEEAGRDGYAESQQPAEAW